MVVASGEEAILAIRTHRPRLVIFGSDMADMTPPEFCRLVREEEEVRETSLLLVVEGPPEIADLCMAAGCNDAVLATQLETDLDAKIARLISVPVRRDLRTLTRIELSGATASQRVLGDAVNVSRGGILVRSGQQLPPDAALSVSFFLPGDPVEVRAEARLIRAEFAGGTPRFALEFANLSERDQERIDRFVHRSRTGVTK